MRMYVTIKVCPILMNEDSKRHYNVYSFKRGIHIAFP